MTNDKFHEFVIISDFFDKRKKQYAAKTEEVSHTYSHGDEQLINTDIVDVKTLPEIDIKKTLNIKSVNLINSRLDNLVNELHKELSIEPFNIEYSVLSDGGIYAPQVQYVILIGQAKYEYFLKKVTPERAKLIFMEGTHSERDFNIYQNIILKLH